MIQLPEAFSKRMQQQLGDGYAAFEQSLGTASPTSVRINPAKFNFSLSAEKVLWCDKAYYLEERPLFVADPLWHAGAYYVQEAGSMAIEQAFTKIKSLSTGPLKVLDMCAAPGGKTTHLASLLNEDDVLVGNEVIKSRVSVLQENTYKWGYPNTIITNSDSDDFAKCGEVFDIILVDAPCSGEGLFRKDPNAISEWSTDNTNLCTLRQKRILDNMTQCLKPGGFLIYSTCTYNPTENEQQVEQLTSTHYSGIPFLLKDRLAVSHQFYPHIDKSEGFFIALLQKNNETETSASQGKPVFIKALKDASAYKNYLKGDYSFFEFKQQVVALSYNLRQMQEQLSPHVYCYSIGMAVADLQDKLNNPSPYLPCYTACNNEAFDSYETDHQQAIHYLGKQAISQHSEKKGFALIQFNGVNLGLGKRAGNRINNLFPNEWRLRRSIQPSEFFSLESRVI